MFKKKYAEPVPKVALFEGLQKADVLSRVLKDNHRIASVVYYNLIQVLINRLKKQERAYDDQVLIMG